jgi:DNA-binding FrmR family transcriptional regulator
MQVLRQDSKPMKTKSKNQCSHCETDVSSSKPHPDHSNVLGRLNRMEGQIRGIQEMIRSRRYCVDILIQMRAATAALRNVELEIFQSHIRHCVQESMRNKNPKEANKKIEELTELLIRRTTI